MFVSGNATVTVSNLDAAVEFYGGQLGLRLTNRIGDRWATVDAGPSYWTTEAAMAGLIIGLQPASPQSPQPGTTGGIGFGIETYTPIEDVASEFAKRGVRITSEIIRFEAGSTFAFADPDGLRSYVHHFPPAMLEGQDASSEPNTLLSGGHAIVYVSNMDAGIRFYTETLGLKLTNRFDDHLATVEIGRSLVLAIHPRTAHTPTPGTYGSVTLGLTVDEPIDKVLSRLARRGVRILPRQQPSRGNTNDQFHTGQTAEIEDLDGNVIVVSEAHPRTAASKFVESGSSRVG
jgi:catechol 2,3-dioxygenase-like lactoylglutathione lyase family enzyme